MASISWNWNWSYICPTGLTPWDASDKFLSPCFQEICLQLPMLLMFALTSAYYFGHQTIYIRRNGTQRFLISLRILASLLIVLLRFYTIVHLVITRTKILPIDVLLIGFQIVTWTIHIGEWVWLILAF